MDNCPPAGGSAGAIRELLAPRQFASRLTRHHDLKWHGQVFDWHAAVGLSGARGDALNVHPPERTSESTKMASYLTS